MTALYRNLQTVGALDEEYDPSRRVADFSVYVTRFMTQSSRAVLGQPYGLTHDEYVDIFPPASSDAERHPVFVLIHGGEPDQRDEVLSDEEKAEKLTMMVCCSGSRGLKLVLDL